MIRHESKDKPTTAPARYSRTVPRPLEASNKVAVLMLEDARDVMAKRELGALMIIDVPAEQSAVDRNDLTFSLIVLSCQFGLRLNGYEDGKFVISKV